MAFSAWLQNEQLKISLLLKIFSLVVEPNGLHDFAEGCFGDLREVREVLVAKLKHLANGWYFPLCKTISHLQSNRSLRELMDIDWVSISSDPANFPNSPGVSHLLISLHTVHSTHRNTTRTARFAGSFPRISVLSSPF